MVAAASAIEQLNLDMDGDGTGILGTCGEDGIALTTLERLWRLFLEHSTLRNFYRIYPVVSDQFGPISCAGVSICKWHVPRFRANYYM